MNNTLLVVCPHCDTTNRVARPRLDAGAICGSCKKLLLDGHPFRLTHANFDRHAISRMGMVSGFFSA